jgi:hypothetical protein
MRNSILLLIYVTVFVAIPAYGVNLLLQGLFS